MNISFFPDSNINIVKIVKNDSSKYKEDEKSRKKRSTEGQVTIQIQGKNVSSTKQLIDFIGWLSI